MGVGFGVYDSKYIKINALRHGGMEAWGMHLLIPLHP
jgi:hypothetical protein